MVTDVLLELALIAKSFNSPLIIKVSVPPKPFNCSGKLLGVQVNTSAPEVAFDTPVGGSTGGKTGGGSLVVVGVNDVSSKDTTTESLSGVVLSW
jgi:hypothetical protein